MSQHDHHSASKNARKAKPHVQAACSNCKKAHLACDVSRPCQRCVGNGKTDTCKDVEHKKRGRPRLRDDRGQKIPQPPRYPAGSHPLHLNPLAVRQHNHRLLQPNPLASSIGAPDAYGGKYNDMPAGAAMEQAYLESGFNPASDPMAVMDTEFRVTSANDQFRSFFVNMRVDGARMVDLVDPSSAGLVEYFKRQLSREQESREAQFLPGLRSSPGQREIPDVRNLNAGLLPSFSSLEGPLNFRGSWTGHSQELSVTFKLAKSGLSYYVVMSIKSTASAASQPVYPQVANSFAPTAYSQQAYAQGGYSVAPGPAPQTMDAYGQQALQHPSSPHYYDAPSFNFNSPMTTRSDAPSTFGGFLSSQSHAAQVPRTAQAPGYYHAGYGPSQQGEAATAPATDRAFYFGHDVMSGASQGTPSGYGVHSASAEASRPSFGQAPMSLPPMSVAAHPDDDDEEQRRKRKVEKVDKVDIGGLIQ